MTRQLARGVVPSALTVLMFVLAFNGVGVDPVSLAPTWWWVAGCVISTLWLFWAIGRNAKDVAA